MTLIAVVAVSARMLAEAAAGEGHGVIAIDCFGDADTRRASELWLPAGEPGSNRLDPACVLAALRTAAARTGIAGWVAGSGCEGQPTMLAAGAEVLPLIGTTAAAVRRVRDPLAFFTFLSAHGIAHPAVQLQAPDDPRDWLRKDARGCGGWHIRPAGAAADETTAAPHDAPLRFHQRRAGGVAMSATFCANGRDAAVLGFNELIVRPAALPVARPYVYCGAVGPVPVPAAAAATATRALRLLAAGFSLQGLCSLDFLLDGDDVEVLEINPRPPATMALYPDALTLHLDACLFGSLPVAVATGGTAGAAARQATRTPGTLPAATPVRGHEIVYARHPLHLDAAGAARLEALPHVHDLPQAGARFDTGDPVCSVSAGAGDAAAVHAGLATARERLLHLLENA